MNHMIACHGSVEKTLSEYAGGRSAQAGLFYPHMRTLLLASTALLLTIRISAATLDVQVKDEKGAPVADAVVYAVPETQQIPSGHKVATMDQKNRMFAPHVLPIQTGTWVEFPNNDDIRHQVYSQSPAMKFQLPLYKGTLARPLQFPRPGVILLGCNIHDQMSAYIIVVDTPYFAKTEGGKATLRDMVAGKYAVHVWYQGMGDEPKVETLTVADADHPSLSFVVRGKI
jgi:plastocyanin